MLVLTRKEGQKILIEEGVITIKILKAERGITSIGVIAPSAVTVDREEVHVRKQLKKELAE